MVEPLAPARYKVQFTSSAEIHDKLASPLGDPSLGADAASVAVTTVGQGDSRP